MAQVPQCAGKAWFHVDMDGLDAIYQAHGREYDRDRDDFYTSAVANALTFFGEQDVRATFFLIARDLDDPRKRAAIDAVVASGHRIGCHGLRHRYLDRSTLAEKREEIFDGKRKIEDALGVPVEGFRAPGYSIDHQSLALLRDAGYRYDTSIFPNHAVRKRLGIQRLFQDPFLMYPESGFFEIPMPDLGLWRPSFHPCYAFYLRRPYFEYALRRYARRSRYLTFLFHLTDFATPQVLKGDFGLRFYTNDFFSAESKRAFLTKLVGSTRQRYDITTTEEFLAGWPASAPDLNPRTILGISTTHETGACIVKDGLVLSAISEERLSRRKLDTTYPPVRAIEEAIDVARVQPDEIDAVAVAGLHWRDLLPLTLESLRADLADFHSWNDYFPHFARSLYREFYFWRATRYRRVGDFLRKKYRISPKIYYVEHHEAHASSAFRTGAHDRTLIVTADGVGDEICITFSKGEGSLIRRIETFFYPHSFGHFYTACTQILGFKGGRHEGKITGLSGFGKPNDELLRKLEGTLRLDGDSFRLDKRYYVEGFVRPSRHDLKNLLRGRLNTLTVDYRNYKKPLKKLLQGYTREDVAYAFQHLLEREMVRLARRHVDGTPLHLVLAGGVFANVKLNMALSQELKPETIFIFPNMGDGGLCVGAALSIHAPSPSPIPHVYLGTSYTEHHLLDVLQKYPDLTYSRPTDLAESVAEELAQQRIVARFDGAMEFGPRALGNRSILYHCGDKSVNDWLNHQLHRTEFMPFAPICLYEDADEYFILREGEKRACEFMTLVVACTDKMRQLCPAAVHVDGTARPQLVKRSLNPGMHAILTAYKQRTGIGCLINTSFNMHEEPIVRTPEDAISAFLQSRLDTLVLGPYLVHTASTDGRAAPDERELGYNRTAELTSV